MKNIIVVDMQKGFINKNNQVLVEKINDYLENNKFDNVMLTKYINYAKSPFVTILNWEGMTEKEQQEFAITVKDNYKIFTKIGYGLTDEHIEYLKNKNITEVEICGTDIDACVLAIMFNLFDAGIKPILLKDLSLSSSNNPTIVNNSLTIIERQFGKNCIR